MKLKQINQWLGYCKNQLRVVDLNTSKGVELEEAITEYKDVADYLYSNSYYSYKAQIEKLGKSYEQSGSGRIVKIGSKIFFVGKVYKPWQNTSSNYADVTKVPSPALYTFGEEPTTYDPQFKEYVVIDELDIKKTDDLNKMMEDISKEMKKIFDKKAELNGKIISSAVEIGVC
jgi:hypothetical protein